MHTFKTLNGITATSQSVTRRRVRAAVKRGVDWLNENFPKWKQDFDMERFNIKQGEHCVFGQSTGQSIGLSFLWDSKVHHMLGTNDREETLEWLRHHGFYPLLDSGYSSYDEFKWEILEDQWRRELS